MGAMTSRAFVMQHGWLSFLIGGGESKETRVELMDALSGRVLHTEHGKNDDNLKRVVVDAAAWKGRAIRIRLVDENRGSWGHISFDDFRTHETAPK
jgi:fructan beta-fructosidase